jgi:hypothetical protein
MALISALEQRLAAVPVAIGRRIVHLIRELAPSVAFFFMALMLLMLLFKLFVSQYSVEFYAFSRAAIGALILGKVMLVVDWMKGERRFNSYPLALVIAGKTVLYGFAVIVFGSAERIFHGYRTTGSLRDGLAMVIANANLDRFLGFVLLISLILCAYMTMQEINRAMGPGALFRLFFARPGDPSETRSAT